MQPHARIAAAEERHIAALVRQLERMGVEVPANPYLGKVTAPDDLLAAATAWAEGEVDNVALYDRLIDQVAGDQALTRVFENLRRASQKRAICRPSGGSGQWRHDGLTPDDDGPTPVASARRGSRQRPKSLLKKPCPGSSWCPWQR